MGNCCEKQALKIIIEGRRGENVYYITNKQLRNIKTYDHFFRAIGVSTKQYKYLYCVKNEVEFLRLSSDFKIKNLVLCTDTEYHIIFEKLYCL